VGGLVGSFADTAGVSASRSVVFTLDPAGDEELLVRLLEEVIYLVDVDGIVPVDAHVEAAAGGGLRGRFDVASLAADMVIGPAPKAVAWHELSFGQQGSGWRCRVTIDV
jgi:SHS2 domain-containing protein